MCKQDSFRKQILINRILKTVNILLIILFLTSTVYVTAQEKQNDATWEEAVEFLKKNIQAFNFTLDNTSGNISINNEMLEWEQIYGSKVYITKVKLKDIKKVYLKESLINNKLDYFTLWVVAYGDYVQRDDGDRVFFNVGDGYLDIFDYRAHQTVKTSKHKMRLRLEKAFEHLAYLANEKRPKSKF